MFNEKIIKVIRKLEENAEAIKEAYELLYDLEIENKKNTSEYRYAIETIKSCIDIEDEYLSNLLTMEHAEEVLNYFSKKYNLPIAFNINPLADNQKLPSIRIMNKIYTYLYKMLPDEYFQGYSFYKSLYELSINLDLLRLTLSLLNDKKEIVKVKYNLAFTIGELENELIKSNYEISQNPYLTRNVLTYNDALKEKGKFITNSKIINTLRSYLLSIFSFKKEYMSNPNEYTDFLFVCSSIRACLAMLDENTAQLVITKIKEFLNGEGDYDLPSYPDFNKKNLLFLLEDLTDTLENTSEVRYTIEILNSLLENFQLDKSIPKHVSLGL